MIDQAGNGPAPRPVSPPMATTRRKLAQSSFADMKASLAGAKVGDTVRVSVDKRVEPSAFFVTHVNGDALLITGSRGAERALTYTQAEGVWLRNGTNGRRVVQAWVEQIRKPTVTNAEDATVVLESLAAAIGQPGKYMDLGTIGRAVIDELERLREDLEHLRAGSLDKHNLQLEYAALGRKLDAVETDNEVCRIALGQINRIAHGSEPGTQPLPSNSSPANVVIDVAAALLRATAGDTRKPITVDRELAYRNAIGEALPDRMRGEHKGGKYQPEPQTVAPVGSFGP